MPSLKISVPHQLVPADAIAKLKGLMERILAQYGSQAKEITQNWLSEKAMEFGFKTMGQKIAGQVEVADQAVNVDLNLPFAALMFKGKIEQGIREAIEKELRRA